MKFPVEFGMCAKLERPLPKALKPVLTFLFIIKVDIQTILKYRLNSVLHDVQVYRWSIGSTIELFMLDNNKLSGGVYTMPMMLHHKLTRFILDLNFLT